LSRPTAPWTEKPPGSDCRTRRRSREALKDNEGLFKHWFHRRATGSDATKRWMKSDAAMELLQKREDTGAESRCTTLRSAPSGHCCVTCTRTTQRRIWRTLTLPMMRRTRRTPPPARPPSARERGGGIAGYASSSTTSSTPPIHRADQRRRGRGR
jgi:hypothetical protein